MSRFVSARKTGIATVERTRRRFVEEGLGCLNERPRRGGRRKLTGKQLLAETRTPLPAAPGQPER
jgi:transposase